MKRKQLRRISSNKKHSQKKSLLSTKVNDIFNRLADALPDRLTGNSDVMSQKYTSIYGRAKSDEMILETKRRTGKLYLLVIFVLILIVSVFVVKTLSGPEAYMDLSRSSYEGDSKTLSTEIEAEYGGESQKKNADITIRPEGLSEDEKQVRIEKTKETLTTLILGDNTGINKITSNLNLLAVDTKTGVEIAWKSENEELISEDGIVNPLIARENETVVLDAQLRIENETDNVKLNLAFGKPKSGKELTNAINASINNLIDNLNESDNGKKLTLPDRTPEGVSIKWKQKEATGIVMQVALVALVGICIFYTRYGALDKKIKETRESVARDFPDFINKLVLLLNAGMVVTAAFEKITQDY